MINDDSDDDDNDDKDNNDDECDGDDINDDTIGLSYREDVSDIWPQIVTSQAASRTGHSPEKHLNFWTTHPPEWPPE